MEITNVRVFMAFEKSMILVVMHLCKIDKDH